MNTRFKIVLLRHGESAWNNLGRFCGWKDVSLTPVGEAEAKEAGIKLLKEGFKFDIAFTSVLQRAIKTFNIVAEEMECHHIPIVKSWRLNEKHYGALEGLFKKEAAETFGSEQVKIWRRSYDIRPPLLELDDPRHPRFDPRYRHIQPDQLPRGESLQDNMERTLPFWFDEICPRILTGQKVLIVGHGNSLRSILKHVRKLTPEQILQLEVPNGLPLVVQLDNNLNYIGSHFLAEEQELEKKIRKAKHPGGVKL